MVCVIIKQKKSNIKLYNLKIEIRDASIFKCITTMPNIQSTRLEKTQNVQKCINLYFFYI